MFFSKPFTSPESYAVLQSASAIVFDIAILSKLFNLQGGQFNHITSQMSVKYILKLRTHEEIVAAINY